MPAQFQHRAAVTVEEFATMFGVSYYHVWNQIQKKDVPSFRLGHRILIPTEFVERLLDSAYRGGTGE